MTRATRWPLYTAVLLGSAMATQAGEGGLLDERFSVGLGTFFLSSNTNVRANGFDSGDIGTPIDVEDTFELEDENVFRVDASWRIARRHILRAMYFESDRSRRKVIDEEIEFAGETFPIEAEVQADFDFDITELAYEYVMLDRDQYQLGASFGIHNAGFRIGLSADVSSPGGSGSTEITGDVRTNAPLPVLGLRGRWHVAGNLYAQAHAQYFQLAFDGYDGNIQDYEGALIWQVKRHVGLGAAYNAFVTQIESNHRDHFDGQLRWRYSGAQLFMRMSF